MYGSLSGLACLCFNFHRKGCTFDQKTNTVSIIIYKGPYNLKFHLSDQPLTLSLVPWAWTAWKFWLLPVWRSHISPLRFWVNLSLIALFFTRQKIFRPLRKYFHQKLADFRCEDLFFAMSALLYLFLCQSLVWMTKRQNATLLVIRHTSPKQEIEVTLYFFVWLET